MSVLGPRERVAFDAIQRAAMPAWEAKLEALRCDAASVSPAAEKTHTEYARQVVTDRARSMVHDAAMYLARMGLSADTIRAALADMTTTEGERAIAWAAKYDRDDDADREDFGDECATEDRREREAAYP